MFVKFQKQESHVVCHESDAVLINAPMESFWSHFKDEYYYDHTFITYEELVSGIAGYINYYNNERYQWKLKSLTPAECRNQAA